MTALRAQALRAGIRSGAIQCRDRAKHCNLYTGEHEPLCPWAAAIAEIYRLERQAEKTAA